MIKINHEIKVQKPEGEIETLTVEGYAVENKVVINLHNEAYSLMLGQLGSDNRRVNDIATFDPCGHIVRVERDREQLKASPLRIRAFRIRNCGLTAQLPQPAENVIFLVSPETRAYLTSIGETRPDVWSCYSVQQFRLPNAVVNCATALGQ
jgi:hypothetical protein